MNVRLSVRLLNGAKFESEGWFRAFERCLSNGAELLTAAVAIVKAIWIQQVR